MNFSDVIKFWFEEIDSKFWFKKDQTFDETLKTKFGNTLVQAKKCELYSWRSEPLGRLAEIIVLDQFSRNIYRYTPQAFEADPLALCLAQEAVSLGLDQKLPSSKHQSFLYMPYMHSESKIIHEEAVRLFSGPGLEFNLDFEHKHKVIIDRFGRYPHRNKILGRETTPEEQKFLQQPDSSF